MAPSDRPGISDDPDDFDVETVEDALKNSRTAFLRRSREFFTDSTTPPEKDPDNPAAESPFTTRVSGVQRDAVEKVHQDRSKHAQIADESYNARTTTDTTKWASNPDKFDYPGVDTVAPRYQRERAKELAGWTEDRGIVEDVSVQDEVKFKGNSAAGLAQSKAKGGTAVKIREDVKESSNEDPRFDFSPVLTHEVGHAVDFGSGKSFSEELEEEGNMNLREEAVTISETMRGVFDDASDGRVDYRSGQGEGSRELVADFVASRTLQPRATKREAPELTERFDEKFEEEFGVDFDTVL